MITNYHILTVKYLGPTNSRGSRIKLISERFEQSHTFAYDYSGNTLEQAIRKAQELGFNVIGTGEGKDVYFLITDTFKPFKE